MSGSGQPPLLPGNQPLLYAGGVSDLSASLDTLTLRSIFCLCPSGTGWGMRVFHSIALGCIPVIIQRDEKNTYPPVLQAFEGLLLDWSSLSVRPEASDVPNLSPILRKLAANSTALQEKRRAIAKEWTRLLWREALPKDIAKTLRAAPDAFDSLMHTIWLRQRFGLHGDGSAPGIIPNSFEHVYEAVKADGGQKEFLVRCSYLEIYNEQLTDLLNPYNGQLTLRELVRRLVHRDVLGEAHVTE